MSAAAAVCGSGCTKHEQNDCDENYKEAVLPVFCRAFHVPEAVLPVFSRALGMWSKTNRSKAKAKQSKRVCKFEAKQSKAKGFVKLKQSKAKGLANM